MRPTHNLWVEDNILYIGYYNGGLRVVDISRELRGDLYRQGREMAMERRPVGVAPPAWSADLRSARGPEGRRARIATRPDVAHAGSACQSSR